MPSHQTFYHALYYACTELKEIKTESTRKLSNFNFQWTKPLYQNNFKNVLHSFLHFSRANKDVINHL